MKTCISDYKICVLVKLSCYLSCTSSLRKAELERADDVWSLAIGAMKFSDVATVGQGIPGLTKSVKEVEKLWGFVARAFVNDANYFAHLFGV